MIPRACKAAFVAALLAARCAPGCIGAEAGVAWPAVHAYAPSPELIAAATQEGLNLSGIELAPAGSDASSGDTLVLLVVLDERIRQTQWLVQLSGPHPEAAARPKGRQRETVVYGPDGRAIRFPARRERYSILALGPHRSEAPDAPVPSQIVEVTMNAAFLQESFVDAAAFMFRAGRARRESRLGADELFTLWPSAPAHPDAVTRQRFVAEAGLTDENERAMAATVPALAEFARVVAETPGLREVLFAVVDKPSVWSILARFGRIETGFNFKSGEVTPSMGAPEGFAGIGRSYVVPFGFTLNDRPALECTILVTDPRPPLRVCGGIVALVASTPSRDDVRLMVRVLAARPGG